MSEITTIGVEDYADKSLDAKRVAINNLIPNKRIPVNEIGSYLDPYYDIFYNLAVDRENRENERQISSVPEVVIKQVILLNYSYSHLNLRVIPLISRDIKLGGAFTKKFKPKPIVQTRKQGGITFDQRINCTFKRGTKFETMVAAIGDALNITGLLISDIQRKSCDARIDLNKLYLDARNNEAVIILLRDLLRERDYARQSLSCKLARITFTSRETREFPGLPRDKYNPEKLANDPILRELESITWTRFSLDRPLAATADLNYLRINHLYKAYDDNKSMIATMRDKHKLIISQMKHNIEKLAQAELVERYKAILEKKFKKKINKFYASVDDLLAGVSETERKMLKLEIQKDAEFAKARSANKCKHINLVNKLRESSDIFTKKRILTELRAMFVESRDDPFLICECGFRIFCKHELALTEGIIAQKPIEQLRRALSKFYSFANREYTCKLCFAEIVEIEDSEIEIPRASEELNPEIKDQIINEIYRMKKIIATTKVPFATIVQLLFNSCYNDIDAINRVIRKSKIIVDKEIRQKLSVYIDIYIYAYFIVFEQRGLLTRVGKKETKLSNIFDRATEQIAGHANVAIRESFDINEVWIKHKLAEIYASITVSSFSISDDAKLDDRVMASNDYVLRYNSELRDISNASPKKHSGSPESAYVPPPLGKTDKFIALKPSGALFTTIPANVLLGYIWESATIFYNNIGDTSPQFIAKTVKDNIVSEPSESRLKLNAQYDRLAVRENMIRVSRASLNLKVTLSRKLADKPMLKPSPLGRIRDELGRLHVWKYNMDKDDYFCDICKQWRSDAENVNPDVISEAYKEIEKFNLFMRIFDITCPVSSVHEYVDATCSKCGKVIGEQSREYYTKYQPEFNKINADRLKAPINITKREPTRLAEYPEYESWEPDFNIILKLADITKYNSKLITALGDYDGHEYNLIKSGVHAPGYAEYMYNGRLYILISYIKLLITEYNRLRFSYTRRIAKSTQTLIEESKISQEQISQLEHNLKSVYNDHFERIRYFQRNKAPQETIQFVLQLLAETLIKIYDNESDKLGELRKLFVADFVATILRGAELRTKYGYFNFAIVYGERATPSDSVIDLDHGVDSQYDNDEGEDDPMSVDGIDVDMADVDPDDSDNTAFGIQGED